MKSTVAVLSSDSVNRYGYRFSLGALEDATWQNVPYGIPSNISHDRHRLIGWIQLLGLYFEPHMAKSVGMFLTAENQIDSENIYKRFYNHIIKEQKQIEKEYYKEFIPLIENHVSSEKEFLYSGCAAYVDSNIVAKIFPKLDLLRNNDRDKLIPIDKLLKDFNYHGQGIFFHKYLKLSIFAHQYFRRSLSRINNFHFIFLDAFMSLSNNTDIKMKIAIDFDMIGYSPSYSENHELEYWYGPTYNDNIEQIKQGLSIYKNDEIESIMSNLERLEVEWTINENEHTLQSEEVRTLDKPALGDKYGCRYVHSIYLSDKKIFDHFDGAVRIYDEDLFLERSYCNMTEFGRRSDYNKLFRIDGKLPIEEWKTLTTHYYQGNRLIYEYFNIELDDFNRKEDIGPEDISNFVPYSMKEGDGVRLLYSYHEKNETKDVISISNYDTITTSNGEHSAIEFNIVEIKKLLQKENVDLKIPKSLCLIQSKDAYWNIPLLFHGGKYGSNQAMKTLIAIKEIVNKYIEKGAHKVISFTLGWNLEEKEVRISVAGHVKDIADWMLSCPPFPATRSQVNIWLEHQSKYLKRFNYKNIPDISSIIKGDGVLFFDRKNVGNDTNIRFKNTKNGLNYEMKIPKDKPYISKLIKKGDLFIAPAFIYEDVICSKTNHDYMDSPYSALFDNNITKIVQKCSVLGAFWSDYSSVI
ncbi:hypothetical protein [Larkinella sp. C7]|uniref:hypothetical protein n=1 Tax=Larkinella sp. C7 TaxID=2576607 RepID=UPI001111393B|nr:hypothetical protein [Larkinella sp. C7]